MGILEIRNYTKAYGEGKLACDNISLSVEAGDIYGFIGHNGAGKSTTIKAVVGVLDFEQGEILIDGHSVKDEPMQCKQITAYIPDNPDLYENLTGIQFLNFVADVFHIDASAREERIRKYADMFEITPSLGDLISAYSHGMKQKVAIISALIHEPKLLVLDEPFVGLDPIDCILFVLEGLALCTFSTVFGMVCGIRYMRLDWENEIEAIKQSTAVAVYIFPNLFGTMGIIVGSVILGTVIGAKAVSVIITVVAAMLAGICYLRVKTLVKKQTV